MHLKALAYLRSNWFALLLIIVAILWWPVFNWLYPSQTLWDYDALLQPIDYWSVVMNPQYIWIAIAGFIFIMVLMIIKLWCISAAAIRLVLIHGILFSCAFCIRSNWPIRIESRWNIRHVMSTQYQGKVYHLAVTHYSQPFDQSYPIYGVFECDDIGKICSRIREISALVYGDMNDQLIVSDNKLILDRGFEEIQILPAVN